MNHHDLPELHEFAMNNSTLGKILPQYVSYREKLPKKTKLIEEKRITLKKGRQHIQLDMNGAIDKIGYTNLKIHEPEKVKYVKLLANNGGYIDIIFPSLTGKSSINLISDDICMIHMNHNSFTCEIVCFVDTYFTYEIVKVEVEIEHDGDFSQTFTETHLCEKNYCTVGFANKHLDMSYNCTYFQKIRPEEVRNSTSATKSIDIDIWNPISKLSIFSRRKLDNVCLFIEDIVLNMRETQLELHEHQKYLYEYSVSFDKYVMLSRRRVHIEMKMEKDALRDEGMFITAASWNILRVASTGTGHLFKID